LDESGGAVNLQKVAMPGARLAVKRICSRVSDSPLSSCADSHPNPELLPHTGGDEGHRLMKDHSESDYDALAGWTTRWDEAAKATENIAIMKFGRALERARARCATHLSPKVPQHRAAATPTFKEPEQITLAEGLIILQQNGLSPEEAKARLRRAFVQKAFLQAPLFAFEYDEAEIDWTTGFVKIPRKTERFCPTFLRSDFDRYFFKERDAPRPYLSRLRQRLRHMRPEHRQLLRVQGMG
jgi:hypothetical protein